MVEVKDLYVYRIEDELQRDLIESFRYVESKYSNIIRDIVRFNSFSFKKYTLQFMYRTTVDTMNVEIDEEGKFHIETYFGKDKACNAIFTVNYDDNMGRAVLDLKSITPAGKGVLMVKRNKDGMKNLVSNMYDSIKFIVFCPILTMLRSRFYVDAKGRHYMREGRVHQENKIFSVIDLGSHEVTKPVNTHKGGKHSHEYEVKGYWRTLKSGKKIWVRPCTKCKGRGKVTKTISKVVDVINVDKAVVKEGYVG